MSLASTTPEIPWYRTPMVWLLIAFPLMSVIGGFVLLTLAIQSDDGLVVDDYYRRGKEINLELKRDHAATALGVSASIALADARNSVRIDLSLPATRRPDQLHLQLLHATREGYDRDLLLARAPDGSYHAALLGLVPGRYHVQLAADDWRLLGSLRLPGDQQIELRPVSNET